MGHSDPLDAIYLFGRFLLSGLCIAVAVHAMRYSSLVSARNGRHVRLARVGSALLGLAAMLSTFDAVENVFLLIHDPTALSAWLWLFCFDMLVPFYAYLLVRAWKQRDQAEEELVRLTATDQLTGALNRRGFFERAVAAIGQAWRAGQIVTVVMLDIDLFKAVNDRFGHAAGDDVLRRFAAAVALELRPGDVFGRVGGEEFALLLPGSDEEEALGTAERLRQRVRVEVAHPDANATVTMSAGVACLQPGLEPEPSLVSGLSAADWALYSAKTAGRDRVPAGRAAGSVHPGCRGTKVSLCSWHPQAPGAGQGRCNDSPRGSGRLTGGRRRSPVRPNPAPGATYPLPWRFRAVFPQRAPFCRSLPEARGHDPEMHQAASQSAPSGAMLSK